MSQKSKVRQARREARDEKQGKKVVAWIFGVIVVLALACMVAAALN